MTPSLLIIPIGLITVFSLSLLILRRIPADPTGVPFRLDASNGTVTLDPSSSLNPLPVVERSP